MSGMNEMSKRTLKAIPKDFSVRPLTTQAEISAASQPTQDGTCGLWWDDAIATYYTPAPSARCPFEAFHADEEEPEERQMPDPSTILDQIRFRTNATSRLDVTALVAAHRAVLGLHQPVTDGMGFTEDGYGSISPACSSCGTSDEYAVPWPCPTVTAIATTLEGVNRHG